jgi:hypothetical protein
VRVTVGHIDLKLALGVELTVCDLFVRSGHLWVRFDIPIEQRLQETLLHRLRGFRS